MNNDIYSLLEDAILQRYEKNWSKSLYDVYALDLDFLTLDTNLVHFVRTNQAAIASVLDDQTTVSHLTDLYVSRSLDFTYKENQFLHLSRQDETMFHGLYHDYLLHLRTILATEQTIHSLKRCMERMLLDHFLHLRKFLSYFLEKQQTSFQRVVCHEYTPHLQLDFLGIDVASLSEPVLDIGCGKSGQLVQFLRKAGIHAVGLDRTVNKVEGLFKADWLELTFPPYTWGSIISHMAFSNHFRFHHHSASGIPEKYARQYMRLLTSLRPGGMFYYAPGLPFIEQCLSDGEYSIRTYRIEPGQYQPLLHDNTLYAAHIMKRH